MINKKILGLAGLASLGLATAPLTAVHADTSTSLESNAAVTFQQDTSAKSPLDPTTPANDDNTQNPVSPIDTVTGTTPNAGTEGLLTIDFASSFNFGSQIISSATKTYSALPQSYTQKDSSKVSDTTGPNFVQVTDVRNGGAKGWSLTVKQNDDFKTASGVALEGAEIKISNGNVLNGNTTNSSSTLSNYASDISVTQDAQSVMGAKAGEGFGTWLYRMGDNTNAGSSVTLTVPGSATKEAEKYTTKLTWTLSDTAVE
ncbi:MAG: WxL domain-containing protein [Leuconostoc mesenteroides]|jgi:hypothetical protein|uniref:WxL domain-containing protein n=1 Tax=Leuconostoc mesenteroides TaxID=1245 RepID=UPI000FFE25EE|nr:WxL domain-containing protein [Leuconostoc mesenteroides]MBU7546165.1 WxL domain-containing protein [Leuconostoc mesenteroides]MCH3933492.1 WxL domain-containing protein [Leuconostoc mesenteroides]MCI1878149.1 WxL domain-containing protein [Leuconostoc mesenteroides]MCI1907690.1 WxL domain-containing protein [Leuconostoc mesenteroides]MCV2529906.1 WxL domain-containing protein [Leuconostoc mesenteroides]